MEHKIVQGKTEPGPSNYSACLPKDISQWSQKLLLVAHGFRPESSDLSADLTNLNVRLNYIKTLTVEQGWITGLTSFRRNGWIIEDAIEDLMLMKEDIVKNHTGGIQPKLVLVIGDSMGGGIGAKMCEASQVDGAVNAGSALHQVNLDFKPKKPILFLTNQSELEDVQNYIQKVDQTLSSSSEPHSIVRPLLWTIPRNGHVNVSSQERLISIYAVEQWINNLKNDPKTPFELSVSDLELKNKEQGQREVNVAKSGHSGGKCLVIERDLYGNLILDVSREDMEKVFGVEKGKKFNVKRRGVVMIKDVAFGDDYGTVKHGEWVGFVQAEGYLLLCKNNGSAAKEFGNIKLGEDLYISK